MTGALRHVQLRPPTVYSGEDQNMFVQWRPHLVTLALAGLAASPAWASPVPSAASSLSVGSAVYTPEAISTADYASSAGFGSQPGVGSAFTIAAASSSGHYWTNLYAYGVSTASTKTQLNYTLVNTSGITQSYDVSFHVMDGYLANYFLAPLLAGESVLASYTTSILVNGAVAFSSLATLLTDQTGTTLTLGGTQLNDGMDDGLDGVYSWAAADYTVILGTLAPGESMSITTSLEGLTDANLLSSGTAFPTIFDCLDFKATECGRTPYGSWFGGAHMYYADPAGVAGTPQLTFTARSTDPTPVPEPGTLQLLALGLGLSGWAAARRQRAKR